MRCRFCLQCNEMRLFTRGHIDVCNLCDDAMKENKEKELAIAKLEDGGDTNDFYFSYRAQMCFLLGYMYMSPYEICTAWTYDNKLIGLITVG